MASMITSVSDTDTQSLLLVLVVIVIVIVVKFDSYNINMYYFSLLPQLSIE